MSGCKVIAVTNQKGGVGKTTTTVNLGTGLAINGMRVLLIDLDPQASLTLSLGYIDPDNLSPSIAEALADIIQNGELSMPIKVIKTNEGVDLLPSNISLCAIEVQLVNEMSRELILKTYVDSVRENYDYILIDCMPSLGMLTFNALSAADKIIIPAQPEFLSAKGLEQLMSNIMRVKKRLNPNLCIAGILLTMVDNRTKFAREVSDLITKAYSDVAKVYDTKIPRSIRAAETTAEGKSIFKHDPYGKVAFAYENLAKEVLSDGKTKSRIKDRSESVR